MIYDGTVGTTCVQSMFRSQTSAPLTVQIFQTTSAITTSGFGYYYQRPIPALPPFNPPAYLLIPPATMRQPRDTAPLAGRAAPRPIRLAPGRSGKRTRATHALHGRRG